MARDLTKIRNIGIAAHIDAGKTTVSERVLYYTGKIHKMGEVHEGTAVMDFDEEEQKRGITINSAATTCPWDRNGERYTINLIDTPATWTSPPRSNARCACSTARSRVRRQGRRRGAVRNRLASGHQVQGPRVCFINKMDKVGADFDFSFNSILERLGRPGGRRARSRSDSPAPSPGMMDLIRGVGDLLQPQGRQGQGQDPGRKADPEGEKGTLREVAARPAREGRRVDDHLTKKYLTDPARSPRPRFAQALRKGTCEFKLHPVFCGSALKYVGVQRLLDGVIDYLPSPMDIPPVIGHDVKDPEKTIERHSNPDEPFCGLAFKIVNDQHGDLTYVRVYSGRLEKGSRVLNSNRNKRENISRMFQMHAADRNPIDVAEAGDIVACIGVKDALTGDTLCDQDSPIILERPTFPEPVISMSIEPKTAADKQKLGEALTTLRREDPTFHANYDEETGQTIIAGMGELAPGNPAQAARRRDHKVDVLVGKPKVAYKETISRAAPQHPRQAREAVRRSAVSSATAPSTSNRSRHRSRNRQAARCRGPSRAGLEGQLRLREQGSSAARSPRSTSRRSSTAVRMAAKTGRARQLPADQREGHAGRRQLSPGRQQPDRVRAGWATGVQGRRHESRRDAARADHESGRDRRRRSSSATSQAT
jgi:elongation factor G